MDENLELRNQVPALDFKKFGIDPKSGFLVVKKLPISFYDFPVLLKEGLGFADWYDFAIHMPDYYEAHTLRKMVDSLPRPSVELLYSWGQRFFEELRKRMFQILAFAVSGYIHSHGSKVEESGHFLPNNLAEPFLLLAEKMGRLPIMSYAEYCLNNCVVNGSPDAYGRYGVGSLWTYQNFVKSRNEPGFIVPHQGMEYRAAPILTTIGEAQLCTLRHDNAGLKSLLWRWSAALREMLDQQSRMWTTCDPAKYATEVRPQIQYFENVQYGSNGPLIDKLKGETGAQTPTFKVLDALYGVNHARNKLTDHLDDMDNYMPSEHRKFVAAVKSGPSIREYVLSQKDSDPEMVDAFNDGAIALIKLGRNHYRFMPYISPGGVHNKLGTGMTPIEKFLPQITDEREKCLIRTERSYFC